MPNIEILDQQTIDKIAAGEVIERPSSAGIPQPQFPIKMPGTNTLLFVSPSLTASSLFSAPALSSLLCIQMNIQAALFVHIIQISFIQLIQTHLFPVNAAGIAVDGNLYFIDRRYFRQ